MSIAALAEVPATPSAPLTPLIGREHERAAVDELLTGDRVRLLTLIGPGGVGKTLLARHVVVDLANAFDGVAFVALADLHDPQLVAPTIAKAIGVRVVSSRTVTEELIATLRDRQFLLAVDNFEHLLVAAPLVSRLLEAVAGLRFLVTSRAPLRLTGEREFLVEPLPVLEPRGRSPTEIAENPAVVLFLERAHAVHPEFTASAADLAAIAEVCARLDGLPLGIELAAARCRVLSPAALLAQFTDRLTLLTRGVRDAPARLRTMRDAIAWSYDLLSAELQALFRRLSVFAGGFTLEAVATICGPDATDDRTLVTSVLDNVETLLEQSLIRRLDTPDGGVRFTMLETIREFGSQQLAAEGEEERLRQRHALWYLAFAEQAEAGIWGPRQDQWVARIEVERDNLRVALGQVMAAGNAETALRLAGALWLFWFRHGPVPEGQVWLERALAMDEAAPSGSRAKALVGAAGLAWIRGDLARAMATANEAASLAEEVGDPATQAWAYLTMGLVAEARSDHRLALTRCEEALALRRVAGDPLWTAHQLSMVGVMAYRVGDHARAAACYTEALAVQRRIGDKITAGITLNSLAQVLRDAGELDRATDACLESLQLSRETGSLWGIADALLGLAAIRAEQGETTAAARLCGAAETLYAAAGMDLTPNGRADHERAVAAARIALGDDAFASAIGQGRALSQEEAIAEAIEGAGVPRLPDDIGPFDDELFGLTPREIEVLRLIATGQPDKAIAADLHVSPRTVGRHVGSILTKLGVDSRAAAAAIAVRTGLA